jgi:AcrR family transcriptional regulator
MLSTMPITPAAVTEATATSPPHAPGDPTTTRGQEPVAGPSETVQRLFSAAAEAFAAKGFHATTTRDIASRAGLSPAGVYVHFASKEDLLFHLSRDGHQEALALVTSAVNGAASPAEALAAAMSQFSAWHAQNYAIARVVQHEFPHLSESHRAEVLALRKRIDHTVRAVLVAGKESGDFELDDIPDTALALLSIVVDVARWYTPALHRTPEQIGSTNAALGLRLVGYGGGVPLTR